jgi:hypothetical protein
MPGCVNLIPQSAAVHTILDRFLGSLYCVKLATGFWKVTPTVLLVAVRIFEGPLYSTAAKEVHLILVKERQANPAWPLQVMRFRLPGPTSACR